MGPNGCDRHDSTKDNSSHKNCRPLHAVYQARPGRTQAAEEAGKKHAASGNQHGIQRRGVVGTRADECKQRESEDKCPAKQTVAPAFLTKEIKPQAQESQRGSNQIHADPKLSPESVVPALPQIAGVQIRQELQRDEVMLDHVQAERPEWRRQRRPRAIRCAGSAARASGAPAPATPRARTPMV